MGKTKSKKAASERKPRKRKKSHHKKRNTLFGISQKEKPSLKDSLIEVGKYVLFVAGGGALGAMIGKPSLYLGIPVAVYAFYKKHHMLGAAAVAAMFTPVVVSSASGTSGYDDMEGFDFKTFEADAQARLKAYFTSIGEKLYLSKPKTADATQIKLQPVTGLNGGEEVSYFINPNNMGEIPGMKTLDRIQEEVARLATGTHPAQMSGYNGLPSGYEDDMYKNL